MHHIAPAEFVPALPALGGAAEVALSMFTLVLWGIALGLLLAWRYTIGAALEWAANMMDRVSFPTPFGRVHVLGAFSHELRAVDYAITQGLSKTVVGAEHATVWLFHHGLNLIVWTAREIAHLARDTYAALYRFDNVTLPRAIHHAISPVLSFARREAAAWRAGIHILRHDVTSLAHRLVAPLRAEATVLRQTIAHTLPRIGHLERDIPGLRARLRSLEGRFSAAAFAGLVVLALSRLGLKWLRCGNVSQVGKRLCGLDPSLLESLLLDATALLGVVSVVEFARDLRAVEDEAVAVMGKLIREWPGR